MKILITGGGSGGHFYPALAVIDALNSITEQEKIIKIEVVFMSDSPFDKDVLYERGVRFKKIYAGKVRRYFSLLNITDTIKTFLGTIKAIWNIYLDFPDVIFSKGGYASLPAVLAARLLGIPLIMHESDVVLGKVNKISSSFAKRISISFSKTMNFIPPKKKELVALVGNPIRKDLIISDKNKAQEDGKDYFNIKENVPIILVTGGSLGAQKINDNIIDMIGNLVKNYQIIHVSGKNNYDDVKGRSGVMLEGSSYRYRYHVYPYLNVIEMKMAYSAADLVISRAGSGSIFEIAASGLPSILIPLGNAAQDHQKENAYEYARSGAADVIEEVNLAPHLLFSEIQRLIENKEKLKKMSDYAFNFAKPNAAEKIAREIINLALEHA